MATKKNDREMRTQLSRESSRTFDGKTYYRVDFVSRDMTRGVSGKQMAEAKVANLRKRGYFARITKTKEMGGTSDYLIWARR